MKNILLVEDDENDVLFMRTAFKKADVPHRLQVASDGQMAIDYLDGAGLFADRTQYPLPSLILLDLNLPFKSGFEVLQWVREHSRFRTLPVVVLTSSAAEKDADRAFLLGANSYVIKPSDPGRLSELARLLKLYWLGWNYAALHVGA
jgi:CheY-like chemotaxis protein